MTKHHSNNHFWTRLLKRSSVMFLIVLTVSGCNDNHTSKLNQSGLVYCSEGAPPTFNPHVGTSYTNFNASSRVLFNRLVDTDNATGRIIPSLAIRWEVSTDGLEYHFHLRENVKFHTTAWFKPSRDFNAQDVIFSFERQINSTNAFNSGDLSEYSYIYSTGMADNIVSIEANEEDQVVFTLAQPDSSFLSNLSLDFASITSAEYANYLLKRGLPNANYDRFPIGTGPFQLNKYEPNAFIRYNAHRHYMQGSPEIKHLVYAITPDAATRYARLVTGECDVLANPPKNQYQLLGSNPKLKLYQKPGSNVGFIALNTAKAPLSNVLFRKALTHAIDRERITTAVYGELGTQTDTPLPPSMTPYHNKGIALPEYNPEKAREILNTLNIKSISLSLWALPVQRPYNPNGVLMAELIQEDLSRVGIKADIISYEWNTYLDKVKAGEHDIALLGWVADDLDAGNFMGSLLSCSGIRDLTNRTAWCEPEFDNLLSKAQTALTEQQKIHYYHQAQNLVVNALPIIPIATGQSVLVANKKVNNLEIQNLGGISFTKVNKRQSQ